MKLKKRKIYKQNLVGFRCNDDEKNRIKLSANLYTEGNISEFLRYVALHPNIRREDLES